MNKQNKPELRFKGFSEEWEQKKLGEVSISLTYGLNAASTNYDGVNKYLRITDINSETNNFDNGNLTSPNTNLSLAEIYKLQLGDILFARTGASVGKTYLYKEIDGLVYYAGFLICAKIKSEYNLQFVFQNTLTEKYSKFIRLTSQRSGQPGVNAEEYSEYCITIPKQPEQKKIGNFFRTLDQLITLQQNKYDKLVNLKKACLRKMFPQAGADKPELRFKGFSEKWEQRKLGSIAEDTYGGATPNTSIKKYWNGIIPWIQSSDLREHNVITVEIRKKVSKLALKNSSIKLIPNDSIAIVSRVGVGKLALMPVSYTASQDFISLSNLKFDKWFCTYSLYKKLQNDLHQVQGTSIKGITKNELLAKILFIPTFKTEQKKIGNFFQTLDNLINLRKTELAKLKNLKKSCLAKMFI